MRIMAVGPRCSKKALRTTRATCCKGVTDEDPCVSAVAARLQGAARRQSFGQRLRTLFLRSDQRRSKERRLHAAQSEPKNADARRRRSQALGIERHYSVPGREIARGWPHARR